MARKKWTEITAVAQLPLALLSLALVFAIALVGCDLFPEKAPPDWEPDAAYTTLTEGIWTKGNITESGREWFKFTATDSYQYIHVILGTLTTVYVQLYDRNGEKVSNETKISDSYSSPSYISRSVTTDQTYYIRVEPYGNDKGTYQIAFNTSSIRPTPTWTPDAEYTTLAENRWAEGNISTSTGEQWFKFVATASYSQNIHVAFGTLTNMNVQFYNSEGVEVDTEHLYGSYRSTYLSVTNGKPYFIKVSPYDSSGSGTYQIAFNTSSTRPPGTWAPSVSYITLAENRWAEGNISTSTGEQWFKFIATASYTQYIHGKLGTLTNMSVQLYDSEGSMVNSSATFSGTTLSVSRSITTGYPYFIKVSPNSGSGTYQIAFNSSSSPSAIVTWPLTSFTTLSAANQWVSGNIATASGEQWFRFTATASTQYIHVTFGTLDDLYVELYNNSGTIVGGKTNMYSTARSTTRSVTSGQIYYIKVTPYSGSGTYQIAFNTSSARPN